MMRSPPMPPDTVRTAALEEGNPELSKHFCQHSTTSLFTKGSDIDLGKGMMSLLCHWICQVKLRPPLLTDRTNYFPCTMKQQQDMIGKWRNAGKVMRIALSLLCVANFPLPPGYHCTQSLVEWFFFSYACHTTHEVIRRLKAQLAGCLRVLSFSDLSAIGRPERHLYPASLRGSPTIYVLAKPSLCAG
jgi:hypothetical protein